MFILKKYYDNEDMMKKCHWSKSVLVVVECDIHTYCKPYDKNVTYAGRGNSRKFSLSEFLVPELGINEVFYIHDCMYELSGKKITGYSKEFADSLMDNLMEMEGFIILDDIYYLAVTLFGGDYGEI